MVTLASYLASKNFRITASDRLFDQGKALSRKKHLEGLGVDIVSEDGEKLEKSSLLIRSSAVEDSTPLMKKALELNMPVFSRSETISFLISIGRSICVAGTSGKTTTAFVMGHIFRCWGKKPVVFTGNEGNPPDFSDTDNFFIVEADESDGNLPLYKPDTGILLNITEDHSGVLRLLPDFRQFCLKCQKCFVHDTCFKMLGCGVRYRTQNTILSREKDPNGIIWTMFLNEGDVFKVPMFGDHNIENCVSAKTVALEYGVPLETVKNALASLPPLKRRLEYKGNVLLTSFYDDFAHNPAKIRASLKALKENYQRIFVIFKPHGFTPVKNLGKEMAMAFSEYLSPYDSLHLLDVFYSGGTVPEREYDSKYLWGLIKIFNKDIPVSYGMMDIEDIDFSSFDAVVTMGARDPELGEMTDEIRKKKQRQL